MTTTTNSQVFLSFLFLHFFVFTTVWRQYSYIYICIYIHVPPLAYPIHLSASTKRKNHFDCRVLRLFVLCNCKMARLQFGGINLCDGVTMAISSIAPHFEMNVRKYCFQLWALPDHFVIVLSKFRRGQ